MIKSNWLTWFKIFLRRKIYTLPRFYWFGLSGLYCNGSYNVYKQSKVGIGTIVHFDAISFKFKVVRCTQPAFSRHWSTKFRQLSLQTYFSSTNCSSFFAFQSFSLLIISLFQLFDCTISHPLISELRPLLLQHRTFLKPDERLRCQKLSIFILTARAF